MRIRDRNPTGFVTIGLMVGIVGCISFSVGRKALDEAICTQSFDLARLIRITSTIASSVYSESWERIAADSTRDSPCPKKVVETHNGAIWAHSTSGQGTCFILPFRLLKIDPKVQRRCVYQMWWRLCNLDCLVVMVEERVWETQSSLNEIS